jgi:hypothetical protein
MKCMPPPSASNTWLQQVTKLVDPSVAGRSA